MEKGIDIYNSLARPPKDALKKIGGGKLSGMTDINPQWRYKAMTERFGLVGIGWKYNIDKLWTEQGASNEVLAFAQVSVYVKDGENWSDPIIGIGGSRLAQMEKGSLVSNDEGFKMAVTDAFSTALKMLGVAADIYAGRWDGSKYNDYNEPNGGASAPRPKSKFSEEQTTEMKKWADGTFTDEELAEVKAKLRGENWIDVFNKTRDEYKKRKEGAPSAADEAGANAAFNEEIF